MTRFVEVRPLWRSLQKFFWQYFKGLFSISQIIEYNLINFYAIGQIIIVANIEDAILPSGHTDCEQHTSQAIPLLAND